MLKFLGPLLVLAAAAVFFYPKASGGSLCGPVCPGSGLVKFYRTCWGIERHEKFIDAYRDTCYGLVGPKTCYGRAAAWDANAPLVKMSCPAD